MGARRNGHPVPSQGRTNQYAVHLPPDVRDETQVLADQDEVARGNWSYWVERVLTRVLKRAQR